MNYYCIIIKLPPWSLTFLRIFRDLHFLVFKNIIFSFVYPVDLAIRQH